MGAAGRPALTCAFRADTACLADGEATYLDEAASASASVRADCSSTISSHTLQRCITIVRTSHGVATGPAEDFPKAAALASCRAFQIF